MNKTFITITDARGKEVQLPKNPQRIVSFICSITETLFELGISHRIVGRTNFCIKPVHEVDKITKIGGPKNPRNDQILSLKPDLLIANIEENEKADIDFLESNGVPVYVTYPKTIPDSLNLIRELGVITGTEIVAERIYADAKSEMDRIQKAVTKLEVRPKVLYLIWRKPYMTINADTYISSLIEFCGGDNVCKDASKRYPEIKPEEIEQINPDIIFLPDEPYRFEKKHIAEFKILSNVNAVKNGKIVLVDGEHFSWFGARMREALAYVHQIVEKNSSK